MLRCSPGHRFAAVRSCAPRGRSRPGPEEERSAPAGMGLPGACRVEWSLENLPFVFILGFIHFCDGSFLLMKQVVLFLASIVFCLSLKEAILAFCTWAF